MLSKNPLMSQKNTIPPIFAFLTYSGLFYYKTTDYGLKGGLSDRDWNTYKNKTSIFLRVFVCVYVCMCVRTIKPSVNRYSYSVKTPSTVVYTGHKAPPTH